MGWKLSLGKWTGRGLALLAGAGILSSSVRGCTGVTHVSRLEDALIEGHNSRDHANRLGRDGDLTVLEDMYADLDATCNKEVFEAIEETIPRRGFIPWLHWMARPFNYELAFDGDDHQRIATQACDDLITEHNESFTPQGYAVSLFENQLNHRSPLLWESLSPGASDLVDSYRDRAPAREALSERNGDFNPCSDPNLLPLVFSQTQKFSNEHYDRAVEILDRFAEGTAPADPHSESISDYVNRVSEMINYGTSHGREWFEDDTTYVGVANQLQEAVQALADPGIESRQGISAARRNSLLQQVESSYARMSAQRIAAGELVLRDTNYAGLTSDFGERNLAKELSRLGSTDVTAMVSSFDADAPNVWQAGYSDPNKPGATRTSSFAPGQFVTDRIDNIRSYFTFN